MQNTTRRLFVIIAVSIVMKGDLANENLNYDTKTKAYLPVWARSVKLSKKSSPGESWTGFRSSRLQMFFKIDVRKNFANFTGKHLCWRDFLIFFFYWVFFHEHSRIVGLQGKGEGISLAPHYNFYPLHRHLDISRAIFAESSPLQLFN